MDLIDTDKNSDLIIWSNVTSDMYCPGAHKAVRDGIADALEVDDGDTRLTWKYAQEKGKPKEYAVRVALLEHNTGADTCATKTE